jgi:hypothetical protein
MGHRIVWSGVVAALAFSVIGCSSEAPSSGSGASASATAARRVFFVRPKNGETVPSLSTIEFGSSGVTVAAVPPGEIAPEQVRANIIHYHLGVDTDCLPDGVVIPKADPWIHFGDGKNVIEMQLTPGPHRLAVQAGDDRHATIPGMCEVISVTVQ